jgi:hypothetical protein
MLASPSISARKDASVQPTPVSRRLNRLVALNPRRRLLAIPERGLAAEPGGTATDWHPHGVLTAVMAVRVA